MNIRENGVNNCVARNKPVTRNGGEIIFYEDTTPSSAINSIYKMEKCVEIKKQSVSIIEVLNMEDFTKIKCDCEGAEFDIFKNLEVPLTVKQIIVEVHEPMVSAEFLPE
jgi:FkbM family methyltransferase